MPGSKSDLEVIEEHLQALGEVGHARRLARLREAFDRPELRVVIFGEFNLGKSTLINAMLGRVVLPARLVPTTGHVTRVLWAPREEVRVSHLDGRVETCALDRLESIGSLDLSGQAREEIEEITVAIDAPLLRDGLMLIDTPGTNDHERQTRRARQAIVDADLVLLMLDARRVMTGSDREALGGWLGGELGKPVVPVVNFLNLITEEPDRAAVRRRVQNQGTVRHSELDRPWFEVNALGALKYALGKAPPPDDDFSRLRSALAGLVGRPRERLQARSRRNQIRAEHREARSRNRVVLDRLREDASRVRRERDDQRRALQRQAQRFDANVGSRRERIRGVARAQLDAGLQLLLEVWLKGESKARLEEKANDWYQDKLQEAIREIEKAAEGALLELAGKDLRRAESMTIRERMILQARLDVGELPMIEASDGMVAGSGLAGGVLGQALIPIPLVGFVAGAALGGWLAGRFGRKEPDYVAAYSRLAQEKWAVSAAEVTTVALAQFDARVVGLKREITERLALLDKGSVGRPLERELRRRERLEAALVRAEQGVEDQDRGHDMEAREAVPGRADGRGLDDCTGRRRARSQ